MSGLRWRWLRWRVRHYLWLAEQNCYRHPSERSTEAWLRAAVLLERVEAARP